MLKRTKQNENKKNLHPSSSRLHHHPHVFLKRIEMDTNFCPSMNHHDRLEERFRRGQGDPNMTVVIQPTDIMLGRGPTCYNNPGNRLFRKLIKENAIYYKSQARRKEKAALVTRLIDELEAKEFRFLHRSLCGTWVEAPTKVVEKKVGHGLRDARLAADNADGESKTLPKNFRPAIKKQKPTEILSGESDITECGNRDIVNIGAELPCNAFPTKLQRSLNHLKDSLVLSTNHAHCNHVHNEMMKSSMQEGWQMLTEADSPSFANELLGFTSGLNPRVEESRRRQSLDSFDNEIEILELYDTFGDDHDNLEPLPLRPTSAWNEERDVNLVRFWGYTNEHTAAPHNSPSVTALHDAHVVDAVGIALGMYGSLDESLDSYFDADPSHQSLECALDNGSSLCHWLGNHS